MSRTKDILRRYDAKLNEVDALEKEIKEKAQAYQAVADAIKKETKFGRDTIRQTLKLLETNELASVVADLTLANELEEDGDIEKQVDEMIEGIKEAVANI